MHFWAILAAAVGNPSPGPWVTAHSITLVGVALMVLLLRYLQQPPRK
jgi:hypothetical protein